MIGLRTILLAASFLTPLSGLSAKSIITEVRPGEKSHSGFTISLEFEEIPGGKVRICATINEEKGKFSSNPDFALSKVDHTEFRSSIESVRKLEPEREEGEIKVTFDIEAASLEDPKLSLVFTNYVEVEIDGKIVPMPSANFFVFNLKAWRK